MLSHLLISLFCGLSFAENVILERSDSGVIPEAGNAALCNSRLEPPPGAVVVEKSGSDGAYTTVQAGVDALPVNATGEQFLFIFPGTYTEQVVRSSEVHIETMLLLVQPLIRVVYPGTSSEPDGVWIHQ